MFSADMTRFFSQKIRKLKIANTSSKDSSIAIDNFSNMPEPTRREKDNCQKITIWNLRDIRLKFENSRQNLKLFTEPQKSKRLFSKKRDQTGSSNNKPKMLK